MQYLYRENYEALLKDIKEKPSRDFPDDPVVKNMPRKAGDADSIPGQGTRIPQALEPLRQRHN